MYFYLFLVVYGKNKTLGKILTFTNGANVVAKVGSTTFGTP